MDRARDDAVALQLTQLLSEHLLRDTGNRTFQIGEALGSSAEEMKEDHQLPTPFEHLEGLLDPARRRCWRVHLLTHR